MFGGRDLHVTENLYSALLRLQDDFCPRVLWIDAICINQSNEKEKEQQIPLMAEIYAKARSVIVWLGEAADDSELAMDAICNAAEFGLTEYIGNRVAQAFPILLLRPWFERIWVSLQVRYLLILSVDGL
jgi:hypothetical protein